MKKHVKLYNRVWEALHADDKFVLALDKTHDQIIASMAKAISDADGNGANYHGMAEAALSALQCDDDAPGDAGYVQGIGRTHVETMCKCMGPDLFDRPAFRLGVDPIPDWFMNEVTAGHVRIYGPYDRIDRAIIETRAGRLFWALAGDWLELGPDGEIVGRIIVGVG